MLKVEKNSNDMSVFMSVAYINNLHNQNIKYELSALVFASGTI